MKSIVDRRLLTTCRKLILCRPSAPLNRRPCMNQPTTKYMYPKIAIYDTARRLHQDALDNRSTVHIHIHLLNLNLLSPNPKRLDPNHQPHRPSCLHTHPNRKTMANSIDYIAIQNVLARYCFALDTKDLALLHQVLTPDIDAQYPFPGGDMQGIEAVITTISKR